MTDQSVVMIVDDDDSVRRAARRLIKSYGLAVETFASADEFLASGRLKDTACLVLDVHMPGMDGFELQSHLIATGVNIPIVFITAYVNEIGRAQALKAGAYCYLVKPFEADDLLNCIHRALQQRDIIPGGDPPA